MQKRGFQLLITLLLMFSTGPGGLLWAESLIQGEMGIINARVVGYVEDRSIPTADENYDRRLLGGLRPQELVDLDPRLDKPLALTYLPADQVLPEPIVDVSSGTSLGTPPSPTIAVGTTHVVAATSQGVFGFTHAGAATFSFGLNSFFSPLSPGTVSEPRVSYDRTYRRFVVLALDVNLAVPDADLLMAVSDDSDPNGNWFYVKIPTRLGTYDPDGPGPLPAGPHVPTNPMIGMETNQIYVTFDMRTSSSAAYRGTTVWNIWKWQAINSTGLYAGNAPATIQAALRPFGVINDYANEVPLTPVHFLLGTPAGLDPIARGIFLVGYGGKTINGGPALQIFWVRTVGPTVNKMVITLGNIDDTAITTLPGAPIPSTATLVPTGNRNVLSAVWSSPSSLWLTTTVVPLAGPDAGETTAHWVLLAASGTSGLALLNQGDVSADQLIEDTYTYYPSIAVVNNELVAVSYSASAPALALSSMISFIAPFCEQAQVALAPDFLRFGQSTWEGSVWGPVTGTDGEGNCVWSHNAHAVAGGGGSWTSSVGRFCVDPGLIFENGFETGSTNGWCQATP